MAYVPNSGSIVSFQNNPSVLQTLTGLMSTNASVITVGGAGVANQSVSGTVGASVIGHAPVVIVGGSILTSSTANQSVSGTVQVDVRGSVATVIIGGSIAASFTPPANQSVSGTVGASLIGLSPVSVSNFPTTQNVSGSVVAFQGTPEWTVKSSLAGGIFPISGSVAATITNTNLNVSGSVAAWLQSTNASIITVGGAAGNSSVQVLNFPANQSVSGAVSVSNFPTSQNVSGSVVAFQGGAPWANTNVGSVITVGQGSIAVAIIAGSIAASFTPPANQSVSGTVGTTQSGTWISSIVNTVPSSVLVGASAFGTFPVTQATSPWQVVSSLAGGIFPISGSVAAVITNTNVNVSGSVAATQVGTWSTSVMTNVITSIATAGQVMGSVAALQGTNPWTIRSSITGGIFPVSGSVSAVITAWAAPSIVGTYLEDDAHTTAHRGLFGLGVRNDTVASFAGANGDYTPLGLDSAGRTIMKPYAADQASVIAHTSLVSAGATVGSVVLFGLAGAGLKNYLTDFNVSNTGAATTLLQFMDTDSSLLGRTIAPAGGGSNHSFAVPITNLGFNRGINVQIATASSVVYVTGTGYRAP